MSKSNYDPYTMVIKEIPELITELNSLIMKKLPGGRPIATVWGVLCEAARMHKEAEPDGNEKQEDTWLNGFSLGREAGQSYAAHVIIRKIADGMGVDNFKLREVPLERPEQPVLREVPVVPVPDGDPTRDGGDPSSNPEAV